MTEKKDRYESCKTVLDGLNQMADSDDCALIWEDTQWSWREMLRRVKKLRFKLWRRKGFDILLAHSPAYQLGDSDDLAHTGFQVFNDLIDKYRPKALVHGHVHQSYTHDFKRYRQRGDTVAINAFGYYIWDVDFETGRQTAGGITGKKP